MISSRFFKCAPALVVWSACAEPPTPRPVAREPSIARTAPVRSPAAVAAADASPPPAAPATETAEPPPAEFSPAPFAPPFEKSAQPGDGEWRPLGDAKAGDRVAARGAVLYSTTVHPHPVSRFLSVTIVAADLTRLKLVWVPGTDDPKPKGDASWETGLVDPAARDDAVAVFNGGFQARHGWWGMMRDGHVLVQPRKDGCTIALYDDASVRIGTWDTVADTSMTAYRQTPPCLLEGGSENPMLNGGNLRPFGGTQTDRKTRRRSAIGVDRERKTLYYGIGEEVGPKHLAAGMKAAGASDAAQLDINWNWTRFLLIGKRDGATDLEITSTLLPKMAHGRREYVVRPSQRDFFFLRR